MNGKDLFTDGLAHLGYATEDLGGAWVGFNYAIGAGRFSGTTIRVGIEVPPDFNVTCPPGFHFTPQLIPMNPSAGGNDRAAQSPRGQEWQYLSRPFVEDPVGWHRTTRSVKAYLKHIKRILETL